MGMRISVTCIKALFAVAFGALCLGNVAAAKEDPLVVALAANTSDYKTMQPLVEQWSKETGHLVEIIKENTTTYPVDYVLAARTGSPHIDVIAFWDFYVGQFYPFLVPLDGSDDPAVNLSAEDKADFIESALAPYHGHPYLLPFSLDTRLFYYRKDLLKEAGFSEPPSTWDELVKVGQALTKDTNGDGVIDQWGFATLGKPGDVFNVYSFLDFLFQSGGQFFDADGKPAFNSPAGVKALQFFIDLRNKYKIMPPDVTTYDNTQVHTGFLNGTFAMVNHWPYMQGMVAGSKLADKVGYAREPIPEDGHHAAVLNAWSFGIMKMSKKKELAFDLIKYVTSKKAGTFEFSKQLDWPLRKSVYDSSSAREVVPQAHWDFSQVLFDIARSDGQVVRPPKAAQVGHILGEQIDLAMQGNLTAQEALDAAKKKIDGLLQ
jgi:multiple sugar transport system substrate-binding protein